MKYTKQQDDFIRSNYATMNLSDIAAAIGKTECAVKHRANRLGCYRINIQQPFTESLDGEMWRDIPGYENLYRVSNYGRVMAEKRCGSDGRLLQSIVLHQNTDSDGYKKVRLTRNGKSTNFAVHRLVALLFVDNPNEHSLVNHIDENPANNHFHNLEWCTAQYNVNYGSRAKKFSEKTRGERHFNAILKEEDVLFIRKHYKPGDSEYGQSAFARRFGVQTGTIESIVRNKSWKYLFKEAHNDY